MTPKVPSPTNPAVIPAKAGIQGRRSGAIPPPSTGEGQSLPLHRQGMGMNLQA